MMLLKVAAQSLKEQTVTHDTQKLPRHGVVAVVLLGWTRKLASVVSVGRDDETLEPVAYVAHVHN